MLDFEQGGCRAARLSVKLFLFTACEDFLKSTNFASEKLPFLRNSKSVANQKTPIMSGKMACQSRMSGKQLG